MTGKRLVWLTRALLVLAASFASGTAMAQYTGEFIICTDGSSPDACRATQLLPDDTGAVTWGRDFGSNLCAAVGFVPQDMDCSFLGDSFLGFDCQRVQDIFGSRVPAGGDLAVACGDISPLPNGNYSLQAVRSSCFDDTSICQNFVLTDVVSGAAAVQP